MQAASPNLAEDEMSLHVLAGAKQEAVPAKGSPLLQWKRHKATLGLLTREPACPIGAAEIAPVLHAEHAAPRHIGPLGEQAVRRDRRTR